MSLDEEIAYLVVRCKLNPDYWPQARIDRGVKLALDDPRGTRGFVGLKAWRSRLDNPDTDLAGRGSYQRWKLVGYSPHD